MMAKLSLVAAVVRTLASIADCGVQREIERWLFLASEYTPIYEKAHTPMRKLNWAR
jgi:hypothetical protein